jgi:hypothetical protein
MQHSPPTPPDLITKSLELEFAKIYGRGWADGRATLVDAALALMGDPHEILNIDKAGTDTTDELE